MPKQIHILCVEDEPDVLDVVVRELAPLEDSFPIEAAASADEARLRLREIREQGDETGLIFCDHIMPGENGVEFLVDLHGDPEYAHTRKVLLTGQAGLEATVKAVNSAGLAHYIAKPWEAKELETVARRQLSHYIADCKYDPLPWLKDLDMNIVGDTLRDAARADS